MIQRIGWNEEERGNRDAETDFTRLFEKLGADSLVPPRRQILARRTLDKLHSLRYTLCSLGTSFRITKPSSHTLPSFLSYTPFLSLASFDCYPLDPQPPTLRGSPIESLFKTGYMIREAQSKEKTFLTRLHFSFELILFAFPLHSTFFPYGRKDRRLQRGTSQVCYIPWV